MGYTIFFWTLENRIAGTFDSIGTRMFSSHIPRQPHQCPGKGGVVQSSVCGGREGGGFVGVSVCGHGFMWPFLHVGGSRTCTTSPLAQLIVLQVGSIPFTQLTTLPGTFHGAKGA